MKLDAVQVVIVVLFSYVT